MGPTNADELRDTKNAAISVSAAARILGCDQRTLTRALDDGEVPSFHVGRRRLVPTEPLRQLLGITPAPSSDVA